MSFIFEIRTSWGFSFEYKIAKSLIVDYWGKFESQIQASYLQRNQLSIFNGHRKLFTEKIELSRQYLEKKISIVLIFVGDRLKKFSVINLNSVHNNFFLESTDWIL